MPPPPPRRRAGWATGLVALVVVIALVGGAYFLFRNQLSGNVGSLQVGDCIDVPSGSDSVTDLQHHPCTDPHDAEVFALINDPTDGDYPGVDHFQTLANVACVAAAVQYLGVDLSARNDLSGGFFYPTTDGWTNNDDRTIDCYLDRTDGGKLTVPLKGIGASPLP